MAAVTKTNPIGLDAHVQRLQQSLYTYLKTVFAITDEQYMCYGLCYRNLSKEGYTAEVFTGGKDYNPVDKDFDKYALVSFFGVGESIKTDAHKQKAEVHIVVFADLSMLKDIKDMEHRGANEAKLVVFKYLRKQLFGFEILGQVTGIDKVLSDYPALLKGNLRIAGDLHPRHAFRFNLQCTYDPTASV